MNKKNNISPIYKQKGEIMNKKEAWDKFKNSGKVEDYLNYKKCKQIDVML